ncbi:MAG: class I SAM-dependent methyltransferase [Pyrinomonadaceae bacterium]
MLKMYHQRLHKGDSPALWEETWEQTSFEEALRFCEHDPLRPLFERYTRPGTLMLEGGCGHGQYVVHYKARGVRVVGLDFAQSTLGILRSRYADLMLCTGDVSALPFSDGAFDLYYSGGVVEHFETGAGPALKEARRVLGPGGVLLISVPYVSPLRRLLSPFKSTLWKEVPRAELDNTENDESKQFFQYVYTRREFERELAAAGLRVIGTQGYGILWGLYDVPSLQNVMERLTHRNGGVLTPEAGSVAHGQGLISKPDNEDERNGQLANPSVRPSSRSTLKRLISDEDDGVPVLGIGLRFMRWACANMMMYVCKREDARR